MIMSRCIRLDEVMKVSRLGRADDFICEGGNFEDDSLFDRKPVEFLKGRCDVIATSKIWQDKTSKRNLNALQSING
jgi:hypothetical protein